MSRRLKALGPIAIFGAFAACSATVPDTKYPPPGPSGGVPYIPFPEENEVGDDFESDEPGTARAATPAQPAAIDGNLPENPVLALERKASCTQPKCELKTWLPEASFAKSVPGGEPSNAAIWAQEIAAGSSVIVPRHHGFEVMGVVLSGSVMALGDDGSGGRKLGSWDALRAPGAGVILKAEPGGAKLVLAIASAKGTLAEALEHAKAKPWEVRWTKRPSALSSSSLKEAKDLAWGGGALHARIAYGGAYQVPASLGTLLGSASAAVPEHDHPTWEHIVIVEGSGKFQLAGSTHSVKPGAVFQIPKGVKHAYSPSGSSRLVAIQIYAPSGPEARFIKLAGEAKAESKASAPEKPKPESKPAQPAEKAKPAPPVKPAEKPAGAK